MTAWYRWHPYELQAFFCGFGSGIMLAVGVAGSIVVRKRDQR